MANTKKYVSLDKLGLYDEKIKKVITDGDAAALQSANAYADSLASNYEAAGSVNTAKTELEGKITAEENRAKGEEARIEGLVKTAQEEVDALELVVATKAAQTDLDALADKVGEVPEDSTVMGIIENIQKNAYDDTELRGLITGLETNKADKTQVATDIAAAVKVEEDARKEAVQGVQDAVDALSGTHATDKSALEAAIALKADQTALEAVSAVANAAVKQSDYDVKVKALEDEDARIVGLVEAEAARAAGVEDGLKDRIETMEAFWDAAKADGDEGNVIDTLKEIQEYIAGDETGASEMLASIQQNAKAIEDMDAAYKAADGTLQGNIDTLSGVVDTKAAQADLEELDGRVEVAEGKIEVLEGEMDTVEGKVSTLEGKMTTVEGAVATKAEQTALDEAVEALEGVDAGQETRIAALEAKFGGAEGSVEDMIADAKLEAIDAAASAADTKDEAVLAAAKKYADDEDALIEARVDALEAASATHALASDLTALDGRVTTAEGEIDTLQTEMDAVEALAAANESAIKALQTASATHALQSDLEAVSGRVTTLETWHNNFTEVSEEEINALFA